MVFAIVIPARKGSKGIANKNLIKIKKKPLIQYTFDQIKNINCLKFIVSDSKKIRDIAKKNNINSDYVRPNHTSLPNSSMSDTIVHFARWTLNKYEIDYLVILQPTSPLRSSKDIKESIKLLKKNKLKSLFSISESLEHPYEAIDVLKNNKWKYVLSKSKKFYRRQDFDINSHFINGAIYIVEKDYLIKYQKIISNSHGFYIMKKSSSLDINDKDDLFIARRIL